MDEISKTAELQSHYEPSKLIGLPGVPKSVKGLHERAEREMWKWRPRTAKGGGKEYAFESLPGETQAFLKAQILDQIVEKLPAIIAAPEERLPAVVKSADLPALTDLKRHQRETMDARVCFMRLLDQAVEKGIGLNNAITKIVSQAQDGTLPPEVARMIPYANARKGEHRTLSYDGMKKWWGKWLKSGRNPIALAPADTERLTRNQLIDWVRDYDGKGGAVILADNIPAWLPFFLNRYRIPTKPSVASVVKSRDFKRDLPAGIGAPTYGQVMRVLEKIPEIYLEKGRMTGAEYKAIKGYTERDASEYDPLTICQIDGHSFKAYVAHPVTGAHFHPEVCAVICMTSKVLVGWSAGLAESWRTVADAYRHACTVNEKKPWGGVTAILEPDRGPGNMAAVNSDECVGIISRIGTKFLPPDKGGNPQGHGAIERSNQSIWIRAAKALPTYTGKDMDRTVRKKIYLKLEKDLKQIQHDGKLGQVEKTSQLLLSWSEFLEFCEEWVIEYNNTPHSALPKITAPPPGEPEGKPVRRHMTPFEAWAQAVAGGWKPTLYEGDMLEHLFMPHERVTVRREKFTLHTNTYHAYELCQWHNQEVIVAYDIHDASQVWVLDLDERPICVAKFRGNRRAAQPVSVVEKAIADREKRRVENVQKKQDLIRAEAEGQRNTIEVVAVRELPKDVIAFEEKQQERQRETANAREGKKLFRDAHELAEDIMQRQKRGESVGDYESRWIVDYQKSAYGPRRIGLYLADPDCAGRFRQAEEQAQ